MCEKRCTGLVDDSSGFDPFVEQHVRRLALCRRQYSQIPRCDNTNTHHYILGVSLGYTAVVAVQPSTPRRNKRGICWPRQIGIDVQPE